MNNRKQTLPVDCHTPDMTSRKTLNVSHYVLSIVEVKTRDGPYPLFVTVLADGCVCCSLTPLCMQLEFVWFF